MSRWRRPAFDGILAPGANTPEMRLGCVGLELPEDLLLVEKSSRRTRVFRHEYRCRSSGIRGETLDHPAYFAAARVRECNALFNALRSEQASFDDVASMLNVRRKGDDFQHTFHFATP
jgi:hypothetical protein